MVYGTLVLSPLLFALKFSMASFKFTLECKQVLNKFYQSYKTVLFLVCLLGVFSDNCGKVS